jgi:starvation-inducible outer membrane lipoprotein
MATLLLIQVEVKTICGDIAPLKPRYIEEVKHTFMVVATLMNNLVVGMATLVS